jgi:DNA-binding response OmpR family regulator
MTAPLRQPPDGRLRVLIVDDHVDTANSLAALIGVWGHDARTAFDGETALQIFDDFRPTVALLDLNLPGEDGYKVAMRLRDRAARRRLHSVMVTGWGSIADQALSSVAGISHHLIKPVNPDALRDILAAYRESDREDPARPRAAL